MAEQKLKEIIRLHKMEKIEHGNDLKSKCGVTFHLSVFIEKKTNFIKSP